MGYGITDFIGGVASRQVAVIRVVLVSYPIAMVLLTAVAAVVGGHISPSAIAWGTLCGVGEAFGIWWFYAALAAGPISVVSPLAAVVVAAGIVLALIAVVLISRHVGDRPLARSASNPGGDTNQRTFTKRVAWLTVGSGVAFGLTLVVIREAPVDAALLPLVFARMSASMLVFIVAAATANLRLPSGQPLRIGIAAGLLDTFGNVCMLLALRASLLSHRSGAPRRGGGTT